MTDIKPKDENELLSPIDLWPKTCLTVLTLVIHTHKYLIMNYGKQKKTF